MRARRYGQGMHCRIATSALSLLLASALVLAPVRDALAASDDLTPTGFVF